MAGFAQIPAGYYDGTDGLTGSALKTQLFSIIKNPNVDSYNGLWSDFDETDLDSYYENDGTILDIYSENPNGSDPYNYTYPSGQCGSYSGEGSCYNREHSFPKSWFNDAAPMYSDLFHIYPTDGKVNGQRSNYPYGEVSSPTWTSMNGSKLGPCSYPGYTGTVFEPIDEFKGDLARTYFYMTTCYEDKISGWNSAVLSGNSYPGYVNWFLDMLLEWNEQDPVSQKEIDRNNAIYNVQGNRNPYIDHPEWVCAVFGGSCGSNVNMPDNLVAQGVTTDEIDLTWDLNAENDSIILAFNTTNSFGTPAGSHSGGYSISGVGTMLYVGTLTNFNHTSLSSQTYYYKLWSLEDTNFSSGISVMATPLMPEPTNHVTGFASQNPSSSSIELVWTDATGGTLPTGYIIKANTSGNSISAPVDGVPENDGLYTKNVSAGTQTVTFTGLSASTSYDFKIYPYTNSGSNINYKTDGTIPQTTGTTLDISLASICEDFEQGSGSTYITGTYTFETGDWDLKDAGNFTLEPGHTGVCIAINDDKSGAYITTPSMNTCAEISFYCWDRAGATSDSLSVQKSVNGGAFVEVASYVYGDISSWTQISFPINESASDVKIRIVNDNQPGHLMIDDFCWTPLGSSASNDNNSDVIAPTSQISSNTIMDTVTSFVNVLKFDVKDMGTADGKSTYMTSLKIYPKISVNTADWTDIVSEVKLNDGTTDISNATASIADDSIEITFTTPYEIVDNSTTELTLSIKIDKSNIINGKFLAFMIDADNNGFMAADSGSTFAPVVNSGTDIVSGTFILSKYVDNNSDVLAPVSQVTADTIIDTLSTFVDVFKFDVKDMGTADGLSTYMTSLKIYPKAPANTVDWTDVINEIKLNDGTTDVSTGIVTITDDFINIPFSTIYEIADNSTVEFTMSVKLNGSSIVDSTALAFMIDADNNGFVAADSGSTFTPVVNTGTDIVSEIFALKVYTEPFGFQKVNADNFEIYPNPSSNGIFTLYSSINTAERIFIYDIKGNLISSQISDSQRSIIDVSSFEKGIYFIKIETNNTVVWKKAVVK